MPIYHVEVEHRYDVLIEAENEQEAERRALSHCGDLDPDEDAWVRCKVETPDDVTAAGWELADTPFDSKLTLQEIFDAAEAERASALPPPCPHTADLFANGPEPDSQSEVRPRETRSAP